MTTFFQPEVSVIIPSYNRARYIRTAVDSALAQEGAAVEIIVVDDGSTDETPQVLQDYVRAGRIRYFRQDNRGPSAARNLGIRNARGQYVCFLDSDDMLLPDGIRARLSVLRSHPDIGLLCTDFKKTTTNGMQAIYSDNILYDGKFILTRANDYIERVEGQVVFFAAAIRSDLLLLRNLVSIGTVMVPKAVLDEVGCFNEDLRIAEDIDLWFRIVRRYAPVFVTVCSAAYLSHEANITSNIPLYYDSTNRVLRRHLKNSNDMPPSMRKAVISKTADYAFVIGYHYLHKRAYAQARHYFFDALRHNPFDIRHWQYAAVSLLPGPFVAIIRRGKQKCASIYRSLREWLRSKTNVEAERDR